MTVCYPNNAIIAYKPKYDSRRTIQSIIKSINLGYIYIPDYASIIHLTTRGFIYTIRRGNNEKFELDTTKDVPCKEVK